MNNKPIHTQKIGLIETAIFQNETDKGKFLTITAHRNYKDKNEQWQKTAAINLRVHDIPDLQAALQKCYEWARTQNNKNKEE